MIQWLMIGLLLAMVVVLVLAFKALTKPGERDPEQLARLLLIRVTIGGVLVAMVFICAYLGWLPLSTSMVR